MSAAPRKPVTSRRLPVAPADMTWLKPGQKTYPAQGGNDKRLLESSGAMYPEQPGTDYRRPRRYRECQKVGLGTAIPCPFVSCKYHLYLDVNERNGTLKVNFPGRSPIELAETCVLAVAARDGMVSEQIAPLMGLEQSRVRQMEGDARRALGDIADLMTLHGEIE